MSEPDQHLMLAFEGETVSPWLAERLETSPPAGVTLFRGLNMSSPDQVAELVEHLQDLNGDDAPLLVAVDQEGGQLQGLVDSTPFAGNMALGAVDDTDLTRRVAEAMAIELTAVGINLNYAPVADVASRPGNPSLGVRSFGEDPSLVARHVVAAVNGFRDGGVLSTLKHFPGKGEASVDPHYELPTMHLDRSRLESIELPPFREGIIAGSDLLMTGHYAVPELTGSADIPVSMSRQAVENFVRCELDFDGLVITDALDMGAVHQNGDLEGDIIATMAGGTDLLLCMATGPQRDRARAAVAHGIESGLIPDETLLRSVERISRVRRSLSRQDPEPGLVGSHKELSAEVAERSITLVRDDRGLLPVIYSSDTSILVLEPQPANVTPADTTALHPPSLGAAMRERCPGAIEYVIFPTDPDHNTISALTERAGRWDIAIVGTVNANPGQARLVKSLMATGVDVVTISMREPQDLATYPEATTHICTYSSHAPSMRSVVSAIFGDSEFGGRLPVSIPGIYNRGHGL